MRIRLAIPDRILDADTLDALLEATTRAGVRQLKRGEAPDVRTAIKQGLRWKPEPFVDGEHFDLPLETSKRGWGDCDDLAPWLAASLRASGEDPRARPVAMRSGPTRWHIRVRRGNGAIQDPSRWAGMRSSVSGPDGAGIHALAARPLAMPGDGAIALMPDRRRRLWWGRCDLPWMRSHVASVAPGVSPDAALYHAVTGALDCSDGCSPAHAEYADALAADLLRPARRQVVGSIFGSLLGAAKGLIPGGGGGGGAPNILDVAKGLGGGGGGGGGGPLGGLMGLAKGPLGGMAASLIPGGSLVHSMLQGMPGGEGGGKGAPGAPGGAMPGVPLGSAPSRARGGGGMHAALPGGGHVAWAPHGPIIVRF